MEKSTELLALEAERDLKFAAFKGTNLQIKENEKEIKKEEAYWISDQIETKKLLSLRQENAKLEGDRRKYKADYNTALEKILEIETNNL